VDHITPVTAQCGTPCAKGRKSTGTATFSGREYMFFLKVGKVFDDDEDDDGVCTEK